MPDDAERLHSGEAWRAFCRRLEAAGETILAAPGGEEPRARAEGYRALARLLVYATQLEIEAGDPRFPSFVRHQDPHNQWGGPNPDNVYLRANVDPSCAYRVFARDARGLRAAIFSLHEGDMALQEYGVYGERSLTDFALGPDGSFELWISADERPGNWIPMHPQARLFTIRSYQVDWERDASPAFHIERVGAEGVPRPPLDPAALARGLERSARWVEASAGYWSRYTAAGWARATPNVAVAPRAAAGGAEDILYGPCFWELEPDEALLLCVARPDADYWSVVAHTLPWLESGDFDQRQTSLNGEQVHVDGDGQLRVVVAHRDPGVPNWIDTEGRRRGMLVSRWIRAKGGVAPRAEVVALDALRERLPAGHPVVAPDERRRRLARRRELAWSRYL